MKLHEMYRGAPPSREPSIEDLVKRGVFQELEPDKEMELRRFTPTRRVLYKGEPVRQINVWGDYMGDPGRVIVTTKNEYEEMYGDEVDFTLLRF